MCTYVLKDEPITLKMKKLSIVIISCLLIVFGCSKKSDRQEGYNTLTVYKNTLGVPVFIQFFYNEADNQLGKQIINPGDSIRNVGYVCVKNCPIVDLASSLMMAPPKGMKIYISDKLKTDYNCQRVPDVTAKIECEKDIVSVYNPQRWIESRKKDTVVKTYYIDKLDSLEAK